MVSSSIKLEAFREIIEQSPSLFSDHWEALTALNSELSDSDEENATKVEAWLQEEQQSAIQQAYEQILQEQEIDSLLNPGEKGGFGSTSNTKPNQPSQSQSELLDQAIKKNSPIAKQQKPRPPLEP